MILLLEGSDESVEFGEDVVDAFQVVLFESPELLDGSEEFNQLGDSSAEQIELAEDLVGRELELFALGHVHEALLGDLVLLLVGLVELKPGSICIRAQQIIAKIGKFLRF